MHQRRNELIWIIEEDSRRSPKFYNFPLEKDVVPVESDNMIMKRLKTGSFLEILEVCEYSRTILLEKEQWKCSKKGLQ